jgi:hypothetical protein
MKPPSSTYRRALPFVALLAVLVLAGCRSILGAAESFVLLAGGNLQATSTVTVNGQIGAGGTITNVPGSLTTPSEVEDALEDLLTTQRRLQELPSEPVTMASLLAGPVAPGFYQITGSFNIPAGQSLSLDGDGMYVFNATGALQLGDGASVTLGSGADRENVIYNVTSASIGANVSLEGIVVAEAGISAGANLLLNGQLLSRTGNIDLVSGSVTEPIFAGLDTVALGVPSTQITVAPGTPVTFPVSAASVGILSDDLAIFAKGVPAGATHTPSDGVADTSGPNGSDLILTGEPAISFPFGSIDTTFSWVPTTPGIYRITYFARGEVLIPVAPDLPDVSALDGPIDVCTVTIRVEVPGSTPGIVSGNGSFGAGTHFAVSASSRVARRTVVTGSFRITAPGLVVRSHVLTRLVRADLGGGRRSITLYGTANASNYGTVPFQAVFVDGGRSVPDSLEITLAVDPVRFGTSTVTVGGNVGPGGITVR